MARTMASHSILWAAIVLQFGFFLVLSALYLWRSPSFIKQTPDWSLQVQNKDLHQSPAAVVFESKRLREALSEDSRTKLRSQSLTPANHQHPGRQGSKAKQGSHARRGAKARLGSHARRGSQARQEGTQLHTLNYKYHLNPSDNVCSEPVFLLVIVESTTYNAMERDYFRRRWKVDHVDGRRVAVMFITANSGINQTYELLQEEYKRHRDILHIDFKDNYRNLTLKTMLSLRWAIDECQPFEYILKTDDDMIVNFDVLVRQLLKLPSEMTEYLYTGVMMSHKPPIRDTSDKWHVTLQEYPHNVYPDYMGGPGYVLSYKAADRVVDNSYKVPFMPMEDVFVGICAKEGNITGYSNLRYSNWEIWDYYNYCWAREMTILHKADYSVRELYYYDRYINTYQFNFKSWERPDIIDEMIYSQKKAKQDNIPFEYIGYPMIYKCSKHTWQIEQTKCMYKHTVKWKIPQHRIITV